VSAENVEVAKLVIDAFNRRDRQGPDPYDAFYTPDFEWSPSLPQALERGSYQGREGVHTHLAEVRDTWTNYRVHADEFLDLGDRVLMLGRQEARGRGSGVPVDAPFAMICDFRGDKISRIRSYNDHGEALKTVGLEK
jgi:ketosteroid isomerase-like protein